MRQAQPKPMRASLISNPATKQVQTFFIPIAGIGLEVKMLFTQRLKKKSLGKGNRKLGILSNKNVVSVSKNVLQAFNNHLEKEFNCH